eukprot:5504190-Pleurochrysis_carterae.AAC.1
MRQRKWQDECALSKVYEEGDTLFTGTVPALSFHPGPMLVSALLAATAFEGHHAPLSTSGKDPAFDACLSLLHVGTTEAFCDDG